MQKKNMFFKQIGDGKELIILHGLFGSSDNWVSIAKKLSSSFKCILIDLPNHGKSSWIDPFNYPILAKEIQHFLTLQKISNANILGHSMGGKLSMQLAHDFPRLFKKMIIVDIAPKKYPASHHNIFEAMQSLPIETLKSLSQAFNGLNQSLQDDALAYFLLKNITVNEGRLNWKINIEALINNYDTILDAPLLSKQIHIPSLFIRGTLSDYIKENDKTQIKHHFSNVLFTDIKETGHWLHQEKPDIVVNSIKHFLK